ncbi:YlzJ-like family protein [Paenibacillus protaetiae]|uniref:YlzJ-like protein n=1 Tax=Paenibacillus protaetiae TaxID=2509456 RepID=A0A4P6ERH8_9BACL|nr:YlzJ-like family protein [Paenibacillus protaetiae]QAY65650.1 hypothetical protein ET464_03885 [Paenibacillus protaetiae]
MTLYTNMPLEVVLDGWQNDREHPHEVWVNGIYMQVEPLSPGVGKVVRLLQCELNDYLKPEYAPGAVVQYALLSPETKRNRTE